MDVGEIKKLIKNSTAVLVLENGEPSFVVLGYKAYKDIVNDKSEEKEIVIKSAVGETKQADGVANGIASRSEQHERETEILDRLNKEILALKNQIEMEEKGLNS